MKRIYFIFILLFPLFLACDETDEDRPPAPLPIITQDPSGTLGELSVFVFYKEYDGVKNAPKYIDVQLFASKSDLNDNLPVYKTYTYLDNSIYFGFLDPTREFYVLAFGEISYKYYEGVQRVLLYPGLSTTVNITMEEIPEVK